ncbi:hypothetical protein [Halopiger aswanensis]|uniref:DUF8097 domain-containing protein n=1 Tax=Halopiger aswanensis TaxID=148449 RepID=A0A419WIQ5_9EURY|nr:hypothetical protein [Halopiger aswanensis]RKD95232.1 hypothetical protein ATJ93_2084 [Halopiger aswanensis]
MGRPWKRIALDFVVGITALIAARQLRLLEGDADSDDGDDDDRSVRLDPEWALVGAASSVGWTYAYDIDALGLRRSAKRRLALTACWTLFSRRFLPNDVSNDVSRTYSHTVGTGIGALCYRFWFGLVRPRPGSWGSNGASE